MYRESASSCITIVFLTMLWLMDSPSALPSTFRESRQYEYIDFMRSPRITAVSPNPPNFIFYSTESKKRRCEREKRWGKEVDGAGGLVLWRLEAPWLNLKMKAYLFGLSIRQPQGHIKKVTKLPQHSHRLARKRHKITTGILKMATEEEKKSTTEGHDTKLLQSEGGKRI